MHCGSQHWIVASLGTGAASLVALLLAVSTVHWLYMTEHCTQAYRFTDEEGQNVTLLVNFTIESWAGLWQICWQTSAGIKCLDNGISRGLKTEERVDGQFKSGAVTEATRIQFPLTCLAVLLTVTGFVLSIVGNYRKDRKTIMAAVMYIMSGLCMSVGVILYISSINDELGHPANADCNDFKYSYGWSFYLIGVSFVMEETSAVISIKLFLARNCSNVDDMVGIIPGLEDKIYLKSGSAIDNNSQTMIW